MAEHPSPPPVAPEQAIHPIEVGLSRILRAGVVLSSAMVLLGMTLMFVHHPEFLDGSASAQKVIAAMAFPHTFSDVFAGIGRGEGRSIIIAGLFVLIATPVMRVAVSVVLFLRQRDRLFAVITLVVLFFLLASFLLGRAGG